MRFVLLATLAALAVPAVGQGFGGSSQQSTTTSQTTTTKTQSGDTTTTTTTTTSETTSSGGGISFGNVFGRDHGGNAPASYESLGGKWKIGETSGGKTCDLTLDKTKFISNYVAHTSIGCPEGLFGVSSWMLAGDEIRLLSPGGSVLAKLHAARAGRWDGKTEQGLEIFMVRD